MTTRREQILSSIRTVLTGTAGVGTRIYRSRAEAFARNEAPALLIEPLQDEATLEPVVTCKLDWRMTVQIAVYTRGAIPDQQADPIIQSLHGKLLADRSLGGLAMDLWPSSVEFQRDQADQTAGWTICSFLVRYRTAIADLSASGSA